MKGLVADFDANTEKNTGFVRILQSGKNLQLVLMWLGPAARHNIVNIGVKPRRLYTLYAPPQHRDGFIARTRSLAEASIEKFEGTVSE